MLNTKKSQRLKSALKDHKLKLTSERSLFRKLRPEFRRMSDKFKKVYSEDGRLPPLDQFKNNLNSILQKHYVNVANKFKQRIVKEVGKPEGHESVLDRINNISNAHHNNRALQSSEIITRTTQKDINQSILQSIAELRLKEIPLTNRNIANVAKLKLNQKIQGRLGTIAASETQNPAEHAKQTEINTLKWHNAKINGQTMDKLKVSKQWVAILDNVTRIAHAAADGQIVLASEPYEVDGQHLMFPGDMSLGATIDNVINCRCSSVPIIKS